MLIPDPGFPAYESIVVIAGGKPVPYPLSEEEGFTVDVEKVRGKITGRTKILVVNTPNNPTGSVTGEEKLKALAELAVERDLIVVSDETYEYFTYDGVKHVSMASLKGMAEHTITVNSFSKTYAMAGWRVGYAAGPSP